MVSLLFGRLASALDDKESPMSEFMFQVMSQDGWIPMLSAVLAAPVLEEVLFRGIIFRLLLTSGSAVVAYAASSLLFGFLHGHRDATAAVSDHPGRIRPSVLLFHSSLALSVDGLVQSVSGFLMALSYHLTGRLLVPILVHAVANTTSYCQFLPSIPSIRLYPDLPFDS